jgi:hypothetical protein
MKWGSARPADPWDRGRVATSVFARHSIHSAPFGAGFGVLIAAE